jgi:4-hydroxy-tetrahydrodipicolinate synthase
MQVSWRGVFPALTTQFNPDYSLNLDATSAHLERQIEEGIHGVVLLGSVGENTALDAQEKLTVLRELTARVNKRIPVLTGVAETTTAQACRYAEAAANAGVDGLMVLPAMIYKADQREAIAHFRTVARATSLPIMVYNNPPAYHVDITPDMFAELADEPTLVCIKESSDNPRRITDIVNICRDRYILFAGVDDLILECLLLGATGWVSGLVNAFPRENRLLWDLAEAGEWARAREVYRWYTPLLHLDTHVKLVQYIKLAAQECGFGTELTRPPRLPIEGEERARILALIHRAMRTRPAV